MNSLKIKEKEEKSPASRNGKYVRQSGRVGQEQIWALMLKKFQSQLGYSDNAASPLIVASPACSYTGVGCQKIIGLFSFDNPVACNCVAA
jgi:hypothetical protein